MDTGQQGIAMDELTIQPLSPTDNGIPQHAWLDNPHEDGVSIHTGFPNAATDKRLRGLDLNRLLITHPTSTFMFRIRGDQGITQGMFDGDIAVVDRLAAARAGDLVLWHNGQQFAVSRSGRIAQGAATWGVVTAVIHPYRSAAR